MKDTLKQIAETQRTLKELCDDYSRDTADLRSHNNDRVEELYQQILNFMAEKLQSYKQFYIHFTDLLHTVASLYLKGEGWIRIRANDDWSHVFIGTCGDRSVSHKAVVLQWKELKESYLRSLEKQKEGYLKASKDARQEQLDLQEQLDAFEL